MTYNENDGDARSADAEQSLLGRLDLFLILFGFLPVNFWISYQYNEDDGDERSVDAEQSFAGISSFIFFGFLPR